MNFLGGIFHDSYAYLINNFGQILNYGVIILSYKTFLKVIDIPTSVLND